MARKLKVEGALVTLTDLCIARGCPGHLRSDNGPEFCARIVREWLHWLDCESRSSSRGAPWENGYSESFNGKLRGELKYREIFYVLREAQVLIDWWRQHYNTVRPYSPLDYRPPAPAGRVWLPLAHPPRLGLKVGGSPQ